MDGLVGGWMVLVLIILKRPSAFIEKKERNPIHIHFNLNLRRKNSSGTSINPRLENYASKEHYNS